MLLYLFVVTCLSAALYIQLYAFLNYVQLIHFSSGEEDTRDHNCEYFYKFIFDF